MILYPQRLKIIISENLCFCQINDQYSIYNFRNVLWHKSPVHLILGNPYLIVIYVGKDAGELPNKRLNVWLKFSNINFEYLQIQGCSIQC